MNDIPHLFDDSHFKGIAENVPILIWTTDRQGTCQWFNSSWLAYTGLSLESALTAGRYGAVHPDDREQAVSAFQAAFELRDSIELEYRLKQHDGSYRWMLERSAPRKDDNKDFGGYVGLCVDVSWDHEQRRLFSEREQIMQQLYEISEREKSFLSCAIHDGILQDIIGADMVLQSAENVSPEKLAIKLERAKKTLRSAIGHGRRLISELRPMILDEQGLPSAIEFYAAEIQNRSNLRFEIECKLANMTHVDCQFWRGNVFRIVQAAMNNVEAHSQAATASIEVSTKDNEVNVFIRDSGIGFDTESVKDSFGMRCMQERAELFGGTVDVQSKPGSGCCIHLRVPLPPTAT